jgi:hypothetical protein
MAVIGIAQLSNATQGEDATAFVPTVSALAAVALIVIEVTVL